MHELPSDIFPVSAVREIDRRAIEDNGIPGYTLMTRAGQAALRAARRRFADTRHWQVVCGAGNNAGDGYVLARLASAVGLQVSVLALVDPEKLTGDAATACADWKKAGGTVEPWSGALDPDAGLVVDAILGSGLDRAVDGAFADAVQAINAHAGAVLALDIPTGIHGDSGIVLGSAVCADLTITFVGLKSGLFLGEGPSHTGELLFADLEIPAHCYDADAARLRRLTRADLGDALTRRARGAHKGDFGHVLIVGGGSGMPGAVRLCGEAALRAGAGLVSIATWPEHAAHIVAGTPELMAHGIGAAADLEPLLARADVLAFGPGLGRSAWSRALFEHLANVDMPSVWDADALNLLADSPNRADQRVITPHPGEAGRLLGRSTADVQADRVAALVALEERFGGVAVLKGAGTLVSNSTGRPFICSAGNPGMASPGMGDVLTGIVAAMLAQRLGVGLAAAIAVEAHAEAGDRAAASGERGLIASDLLGELRGIVNP